MSTYNGWTNYATWRINLEIFDGVDLEDMSWDGMSLSELAEALQEYTDELLTTYSAGGPCGEGLTLDYARAFVSQVNWHEIAQHLLDDVQQNEEESEE